MQSFTSLILNMAAFVGVLVGIGVASRMRPTRQSALAMGAATFPALIMLTLFYSLAIHMRQSLGAWPTGIGERGFPAVLITHGAIAINYFTVLVVVSVFAWPVAFLICVLVRRWRGCFYYLGVYAFACLACFGAMLLAPAQFLNWWWD